MVGAGTASLSFRIYNNIIIHLCPERSERSYHIIILKNREPQRPPLKNTSLSIQKSSFPRLISFYFLVDYKINGVRKEKERLTAGR